MDTEFTGERVIPGAVDRNLWNEHIARYAFARRLGDNRRVLDIGCGAGYGALEFAPTASSVIAIDISRDALSTAVRLYPDARIGWTEASATALPFLDASFDLIVAFEVIEHLPDWQRLLAEARRLLTPSGQFIVSTPNRSFYNESRRDAGPNPFHHHEFEYEEFRAALFDYFPHLEIFVEDHTEGILFRSTDRPRSAEVRFEGDASPPQQSNFFIAVCAIQPQADVSDFVYVPSSANLLRERGIHIDRLQGELETKNKWLGDAQAAHQLLLDAHHAQAEVLEQRTAWAEDLNLNLQQAGARIDQLQKELTAEQAASADVVRAYEEKTAELESRVAERTHWAMDTEERLTIEIQNLAAELGKCVELLNQAEANVEERTRWAQDLEQQKSLLEARLNMAASSRWIRVGRAIGVGPELLRR